MAEEITLRAYTERIETMLRQSRIDEAIANAAHVLQFYPKNANIYRYLGQALMRQKRYEEASEIFRRLLAAVPNDFSAHFHLSVVYENDNSPDAALWHIERAFDQEPNNQQVNDRMRELYKTFRNLEVDKIQLTAGAVAGQYIKGNMIDEALEVLNRTLEKIPDRADLRLLQATALWEKDERIEAADAALDVLSVYPYALEANRILSELWLDEDRPSDAQRYLVRLEAIDPYLAYEIATESIADESHFLIEPLDFSKYAASLATADAAPDWLSDIEEVDDASPTAESDFPVEAEAVGDVLEEDDFDDFDFSDDADDFGNLDDLLDDDDDAEIFDSLEDMLEADDADIAEPAGLDWLDELHGDSQPPEPLSDKKVTDNLSDLLPDEFMFPESAGTDDTVSDDLLNGLGELPEYEAPNDDNISIDDIFADFSVSDDDYDDDDSTGLTGLLGEDDYESGLGDSLTGLLDKLSSQQVQQVEDDDVSDDTDWLSQATSGDYDLSDYDDNTDDLSNVAVPEMEDDVDNDDDPMAWLSDDDIGFEDDFIEADPNPDDSMAWMAESGIEFDENAPDRSPLSMEDEDPVTLESTDVDPMAWLGGDNNEDDPDTYKMDTTEFNDGHDGSDDPMAWLQDDGIDFEESSEFEALDTGQLDESADESMAWLAESGIEIDDDPNDLLTGQLENLDASPLDDDDPMAWLEEDGVEFLDDTGDAVDESDWLDDDAVLDDLLNLADLTNTSGNEPITDDDLSAETEMQDTMTDNFDSPQDQDDDLPWMMDDDSDVEDDSMAWLADDDTNLDAEPEDDSMAWLTESGIEIEDEVELDADPDSAGDPMAWLDESDPTLENESAEDAFQTDDEEEEMPWVSNPEAEEAIAEEFNFMEDHADNLGIDSELPDEVGGNTGLLDFLGTDDAPEMDLSDIGDISEDEVFDDAGTDWLRAIDATGMLNDEAVAEDFGWVEGESDETAEDASDESSDEGSEWGVGDVEEEEQLDWMTEMTSDADDFEDFEAEPADTDWLNDLRDEGDASEADGEFEAEPANAEWLSEIDTEEDESAWMASAEDEEESDDELESGWMAEEEAEPADADWLSELDSDDEDVQEFEGFESELDAEPAEADWLSELDSDDEEVQEFEGFESEAVAEPADADWLSELDSDDEDVQEFEGFESELDAEPAEADWLAGLEEEMGDDFGMEDDAVVEEAEGWGDVGPGFTGELGDVEEVEEVDGWGDVGAGFTEELTDPDPEPAEMDWMSDDEQNEFDDMPMAQAEEAEDGMEWMIDSDDDDYSDDDEFAEFEFGKGTDEFADFVDEEALEEPEEQEADWLTSTSELEEAEEEDWGVPSKGFTDKLNPDVVEEASRSAITSFTDRLQDYEQEDEAPVADDSSDWLSDVGVIEEDEWDDEELEEYYGDDLNIATKGMSDMLESIRNRDDEFEATIEEFEAEEPEWLKATGEYLSPLAEDEGDADDDYFVDPNEEIDEAQEQEARPRAENAFELLEAKRAEQFGEDTEQEDADNAPDWLNAMVPGLDLDFEAEDEGHLDEGFEERERTLRERNINESDTVNEDFGWLQDIVVEETGMMDAMEFEDHSTPPPPPMGMPERRVYEFSSLPVWALGESLTTLSESGGMPSDSLPDYLDFDEFGDEEDYAYDDLEVEDNFTFDTDEVSTEDETFNIEDSTATVKADSLEIEDDIAEFETDLDMDDDFDDEFDGDFGELDDYDDPFDDDFDK